MPKYIGDGVSRRNVLRGAVLVTSISMAAGLATVLDDDAATAASGTDEMLPPLATTRPVAAEQYVATMPHGGRGNALVLIDRVHAEYERAVSSFPQPLPPRYAFPAQSRFQDSPEEKEPVQYEPGLGGAEAYMFWQNATATAAYAAQSRGDMRLATSYIDTIEATYASPIRKLYFDDPKNVYITDVLSPARNGDYLAVLESDVEPFLNYPPFRAIANAAGDVVRI